MKKLTSENKQNSSLLEEELIYAIRHSQYQQLALYLRNNYKLNIISKDGRNGLFYALDIQNSSKRCRMIKYCLDHGINPLQKDKINGYTVLQEAIARQQIDSFQLLLADVEGEIDWRALDNQGRTILHQVVESNNTTILEDLLTITNRYSISVDIPDKNGLTPYLLAKKLHLNDMSELLIRKGHASRYKSDLQTHRSAREWESMGIKESNLIIRRKLRNEINEAMRNGRLNQVHKLKKLSYPVSSLSFNEKQRRDSYITATTHSGLNTSQSSLSINEPERYMEHHLPPINPSPQHRLNTSYNSLLGLFQIA